MADTNNTLADAQALLAQMKTSNTALQQSVNGLVEKFDHLADGIADDFEKTESELIAINQNFLAKNEADIAKTAADINLMLEK
jgi:uncharacterized coiled-coil protein SlyX